MKIFWDTNVLIDLLMLRMPFYDSASTILTMAEENKWEIVISSLSIVNSNYVCCERGKMPKVMWERKIIGLSSLVTFCSLTPESILESCFSEWTDYEDRVQYSCALSNQCDYIVTRNIKDYQLSSIPVVDPNEFILLFQS